MMHSELGQIYGGVNYRPMYNQCQVIKRNAQLLRNAFDSRINTITVELDFDTPANGKGIRRSTRVFAFTL